jgi:CBS domain-containing protein
MWWPALGAIAVGIGGLFVPQALGVGYPVIGAMVDGRLAFGAVFAILVVKTVMWVLALSSGTSGGVLAPLLMIGGAIGALASGLIPQHDEAVWATIGMAAMLGGTMRAPFTATVFALETTHDWTLLTGVFAGAVAAMAVTVVFVKRSILTERLARRGTHVAREYAVHPLESTAVSDIMVPRERVESIPATLRLAELRRRLGDGSAFKTHDAYPVVAEDGTLLGVIRRSVVLAHAPLGERVAGVAEAAVIIRPNERVRTAVDMMAKTNHRSLIVVEPDGTWIGLIDQGDVLDAWRRTAGEEESRSRVRLLPFSAARSKTADLGEKIA